jgi:hypothetical protein
MLAEAEAMLRTRDEKLRSISAQFDPMLARLAEERKQLEVQESESRSELELAQQKQAELLEMAESKREKAVTLRAKVQGPTFSSNCAPCWYV